MSVADRVLDLVAPVVESLDLELVDVEHSGSTLRVTVDAESGLDAGRLSKVSRALSRTLDEHDPIPGAYNLEVSSPGLERRLRTPEHYRRSLGDVITVKTLPETELPRRLQGVLQSASEDEFVILVEGRSEPTTIDYDEVQKARTVFDWGPKPKPGKGPSPSNHRRNRKEGQ